MTTLRDLREARSLTQDQVTNELNARGQCYRSGRALIHSWEKGKTRPAISALVKLADIYEVSVGELVSAVECSGLPSPSESTDPEKPP
jgi:transcriptional regulator with XRE-family HTH domain